MSDFTATRTYLYVAGNVISPLQNTANELGIYNPHNAAFNASSGHHHTGQTGDAPKIRSYDLDNVVLELPGSASPYTVTATSSILLCATDVGAFQVIIPNPYPSTWSNVLKICDASGNAGTYNIQITVYGYGIDALTGSAGSVYIVEDWGSITMVRMSSGYWKII